MFCTIAPFCVDDHVVIVAFLLPDFLDFFSAYCNTFTARTDLSPLSPTEMYDKSLFTLIARIGFSYVSRILGCILAHFSAIKKASLAAVGIALRPRPWLFFFTGSWVPSLAVCLSSRPSSPCSSAHLLADCFSDHLSPVANCDRVHVSCSWHALQTYSFAFLF